MSVNGLPGAHNAGLQPIDSKGCHTRRTRHTKVLFVSKGVLANGRGRWLAIAASLVVSAAILYAQGAEHTCCRETPAAIPTGPDSAPANAPRIASPTEADLLAASAPVAAQQFQFALPAGVASEEGLQVKTIWVARAVSVLFPQITNIFGYIRRDRRVKLDRPGPVQRADHSRHQRLAHREQQVAGPGSQAVEVLLGHQRTAMRDRPPVGSGGGHHRAHGGGDPVRAGQADVGDRRIVRGQRHDRLGAARDDRGRHEVFDVLECPMRIRRRQPVVQCETGRDAAAHARATSRETIGAAGVSGVEANCAEDEVWGQLIMSETSPDLELFTATPRTGMWRLNHDGRVSFARQGNDWATMLDESEAFYMRVAAPGDLRCEGAQLGVLVTRGHLQTDDYQLTERGRRWMPRSQRELIASMSSS